MRPEHLTTDSSSAEQSRCSVTDYFEKYPASKPIADQKQSTGTSSNKENKPVSLPVTATSHFVMSGDKRNNQPSSEFCKQPIISGTIPRQTGVAPNAYQNPENGGNDLTPQRQLYKGTELDTSLSTIKESDDVMSVISSAVTLSSVTSIDDAEFRHGLANLDANIARIQASLKQVTQK